MSRHAPTSSQLPPEFLTRLSSIFPPDIARTIERTFIERPTSFRCNTLRTTVNEALETLKREGFTTKRLNWCREGFLLTNRSQRDLVKLDLFKTGAIYLQSLASMVPVLVLDPRPGERVLDMTAAPGSKTSQIAASMNREGSLHACELDEVRFQRLSHNMNLLGVQEEGAQYLTLHKGDASQTFKDEQYLGSFDKILLDAPCSAESRMITRERRSFSFWGDQAIRKRAAEQKKLLDSAWKLLRPGGVLVYSTCTFAPEENEAQLVDFAIRNSDAEFLEIPNMSGLTLLPGLAGWRGVRFPPQIRCCRRIVPTAEVEGFFVGKMRKR